MRLRRNPNLEIHRPPEYLFLHQDNAWPILLAIDVKPKSTSDERFIFILPSKSKQAGSLNPTLSMNQPIDSIGWKKPSQTPTQRAMQISKKRGSKANSTCFANLATKNMYAILSQKPTPETSNLPRCATSETSCCPSPHHPSHR